MKFSIHYTEAKYKNHLKLATELRKSITFPWFAMRNASCGSIDVFPIKYRVFKENL